MYNSNVLTFDVEVLSIAFPVSFLVWGHAGVESGILATDLLEDQRLAEIS